MRRMFDEQLNKLNVCLLEMASLIENAIEKAIKALINQDVPLAKSIIKGDVLIDDKEKEIESICLKLLLQQQPVARDLRLISTALKIITDMERIGDHATDISELTIQLSKKEYLKKLDHISEMVTSTVEMVHDSINAYINKDIKLAESVITHDDVVDELFLTVKNDIINLIRQDAKNGEQCLDLLMVAKYLERIGDHATNIAEWVVFSITGVHKDKQIL